MTTALDKLITKIIMENYDNDYDPYLNNGDPDFYSEFPLKLFYENQDFLNQLSNIGLFFDRKMTNRIIRFFKGCFEEDEVFEAIRNGNLTELSVFYACSIANKICRQHKPKN